MKRHLLVIGAMKCGTTTFHNDLGSHPAVFTAPKESAWLRRFPTSTARGARRYLAQWAQAPDDALCVEVDTTYSMVPHVSSVAGRAAAVVPQARIVYLVRDPVQRIISHHLHDFAAGLVEGDIDAVVRRDARFLDYSRYATQLAHWTEHFPVSAIRLVPFETYVRDRRGVLNEVLEWTGTTPLPLSDLGRGSNLSSNRRAARGALGGILRSGFYRRGVRAALPPPVREKLRERLVPQAPSKAATPAADTVAWLRHELAPEMERLARWPGGGVVWPED